VLLVEHRTGRAAAGGLLLSAALLPYVVAGPLVGNGLDRTARPRLRASLLAAGYAAAMAVLLIAAGGGMALPGHSVEMTVELGKPVAMTEGLGFAIREGGRTVGAGTVTTVLD
jgi:hypothetical protein